MLKKYVVRKQFGWAIIVIDTEIGYFSTVSDYGNYAYIWTNPGCEFRQFLTQVDSFYLLGKLMNGRPDKAIYAGEETKQHIKDFLNNIDEFDRNRKPSIYKKELALLENNSFHSDEDFREWYEKTSLDEAYEFRQTRANPQCMGFCEKLWPDFVEMLKKELDEEARVANLGGSISRHR